MDTSARSWDSSGHDLQGIMPARSSHDDPIDSTLGDPTALLGLHLGSDPAIITHTPKSLPQSLPSHPQLLSSPSIATPDFSQHPDPRRHWDAWNPLLVTNPQPLLNLPPVPTDLRPTYSYQQSAPSENASLYNNSLRSSDSGYGTRSTSTASSYAVDTACSPQFASPQGPESACSSPDQDNREGSVQPPTEHIKCDHPNCKWSGRCPSDKRKHEARHKKLFKCDEPNCARREGFGTINDLARHKKCVHKQEPMRGPKVLHMCFGNHCTRKGKMWPRLDNFKQHLTRMHGGEDAAELLKKSEEWYQEYAKTQDTMPDGLPHNDMGFFGQQDGCTAVIPSQTVTSSDFQWSLESECSKTVISESSNRPGSLQSSPVAPPIQSPLRDQAATQLPLFKSNDQPPPRMRTDSILSTETARDTNVETSVTEAAGSVINAMSKLMDRNQHRQQQLNDEVDMMDPNSDLCGRKKELLQKIFAAALDQLSSDRSANRVASDPQPEAGKESWFTCDNCPKRTRLRCEMKKHQKRHERPYGCTFDGCNKTFGSKADWKRHESSQHFHFQGWRCTMSDPDNSHMTCARLFDQQEVYVQHVRERHCVDEDVVQMAMKNSYLDPNGQEQYWCGFCRDIIPLRSRGLAARNERFNHIDSSHIKKGQRIGDWLPLSGNLTKNKHNEIEYDTRATSDEDYDEDDDDNDSPRKTCLWDRMSYDGSGNAISVQRNDIGLRKRRRVSPGSASRKSRRVNSVEDSDCDSTECDLGLDPVPELFG